MRSARSSGPSASADIYADPALYDFAFGHRDITQECDGILRLAHAHGLERPRVVVELACGPAHHARELARRGLDGYGIDASAAMLRYARVLNRTVGPAVALQRGDMRTTRPPVRADLALCLFDSFAHLLSDADGVAALRNAARALTTRGLLVLEVAHPAEYFQPASRRRTLGQWTRARTSGRVRTRLSATRIDPVAETYVKRIDVALYDAKGRCSARVVDRHTQRMWLRSGIASIAAQSGVLELTGMYGAFDPRVRFSMRHDAWRMVAVFKRRARS